MLPITLAEFSISPCVFVKTERRVLVCSFIDNAINLHAFRDEKRTRRRKRKKKKEEEEKRKKKERKNEREKKRNLAREFVLDARRTITAV